MPRSIRSWVHSGCYTGASVSEPRGAFVRPMAKRLGKGYNRPTSPKADNMTVCVATIYDNGTGLFTASDRMLSGTSQYESPEKKWFPISTSIGILFSNDDVSFQRGIHNRLRTDIGARIDSHPDRWVTVEEVAYAYEMHYTALRTHLAQQEVLAPFGLSLAEFTKLDATKNPSLVQRLASRLEGFPVPYVSALVVGMDKEGPHPESNAHIYKFDNFNNYAGRVVCEDAVGYAAIGSGSVHADSQLTHAAYGPSRSEADAFLLTYLAKKRGEAAPGVGKATDILIFRHRPPHPAAWSDLSYVPTAATEVVEKAHSSIVAAEEGAYKKQLKKVSEYLKSLGKPTIPSGQASITPPPPSLLPSPDIAPGKKSE